MGWIRRETEKGTTQYICPNCHDYHEFREDFGEQTFNENFVFCRRCGARNGTGTAPPLTPPNEPLTLEELRKMDGVPVWVELYQAWALVEIKQNGVVMFYGNDFSCSYSRTWQVYRFQPYRRPPEVSP